MSGVRFSYRAPGGWLTTEFRVVVSAGLLFGALAAGALAASPKGPPAARVRLHEPLILTQLPVGTDAEKQGPVAGGMLRARYGERARIVVVLPDLSARVLSGGFHSACDPEVSFDGKRILFAGKRTASDNWNVFEMSLDRTDGPNRSRATPDQTTGTAMKMAADGSDVRQITRGIGDCRSPSYQSTLYTIISTKPWYQLTFVGDAGTMDEHGSTVATNLYSCKLDGSAVRRLTYNLSSDMDPVVMPDGRLLFASRQRGSLEQGVLGRVGLFGINIDGADYALFAENAGRRIKHMPCVTLRGLAVFVEADRVPWDGAGYLSCVQLRRPLHSYRQITGESDGLFHSPSPLPDGRILVSRRPRDGRRAHGVYRFDPASKKAELVFDDPRFHDIQARLIYPRAVPDGRSSVVTEKDPHGKLYCLSVYDSDLEDPSWMPPGTARRVRVLEGVPLKTSQKEAYLADTGASPAWMPGSTINGIPPLPQRRILGEIPVEEDGSFNIEVPANTPIELQLLDADGMALRSCRWIWAKNHEPRGCIGCHEDGERTPENWFRDALSRASIPLCLPPERRRTVDFRRDVMPIIDEECAACHGRDGALPRLDGGPKLVAHPGGNARFNRAYESLLAPARNRQARGGSGQDSEKWGERQYVHPGRARTSPLIWQIFGRNTSRPWDGVATEYRVERTSRCRASRLAEDEKRTFVEWIDFGALWDGIPGADNLPRSRQNRGERDQ